MAEVRAQQRIERPSAAYGVDKEKRYDVAKRGYHKSGSKLFLLLLGVLSQPKVGVAALRQQRRKRASLASHFRATICAAAGMLSCGDRAVARKKMASGRKRMNQMISNATMLPKVYP